MSVEEKARQAALIGQGAMFWLMAASGPDVDRAQARHCLSRAFQAYQPFRSLMAELEALAPNASAEGYANAACLAEISGGQR